MSSLAGAGLLDWLELVQEAPRVEANEWLARTRLRQLVDGTAFQGAIGMLIILSIVFLAFETDKAMDPAEEWGSFFFFADVVFTSIFVVEIVLRIGAHGIRFFQSRWNILELALVGLGVVDLVASSVVANSTDKDNNSSSLGVLMLLRFLRFMKLLRMGRVVHAFRELTMLCNGVVHSFRLLIWSVLLLALLIFAAAIFCTREIGVYWAQGDFEEVETARMRELFGSVVRSMYTLFQVQTLESWSEAIARPVLRRRPELVLFFLPYVVLITICVLNVIVAIIVENVIKDTLV